MTKFYFTEKSSTIKWMAEWNVFVRYLKHLHRKVDFGTRAVVKLMLYPWIILTLCRMSGLWKDLHCKTMPREAGVWVLLTSLIVLLNLMDEHFRQHNIQHLINLPGRCIQNLSEYSACWTKLSQIQILSSVFWRLILRAKALLSKVWEMLTRQMLY